MRMYQESQGVKAWGELQHAVGPRQPRIIAMPSISHCSSKHVSQGSQQELSLPCFGGESMAGDSGAGRSCRDSREETSRGRCVQEGLKRRRYFLLGTWMRARK